jgi:hypothetical protein
MLPDLHLGATATNWLPGGEAAKINGATGLTSCHDPLQSPFDQIPPSQAIQP